jgi:iturin family lipopeptide synthetase A
VIDLVQRFSRLSPEQKKLLELKIKKKNIDISKTLFSDVSKTQIVRDIEPAEEKEYYPLSSSQKRIYILNLFMEYTLSLLYQVEGCPNPHRFQEIFERLIARHESLRTSFVTVDGEPVQRVHETVDFEIEYYDLNKEDTETAIERLIRPFDLARAPLIQVILIKLSEARHLFFMNMHHLISDGVSRGILTREFIRIYGGERLPELTVRYRDFSLWQHRVFNRERAEYRKQEAFWLDRFAGEIPVLNMPTDYPRPTMQSFASRKLRFVIEAELFRALKELALKQDASPYMVLLSVCNTLLFRYTDQEDIVIGTITAGRGQGKVQDLIGVFINPLAMRNFPAAYKTFADFLRELKQDTLAAYENQLYPFGDLLEKVVEKKDFSRNPLFDVLFVFRNLDIDELDVKGLRFSLYEPEQKADCHAQQDITFWAVEEEGRVRIDLEYCTALFKQETMERLAEHFLAILRSAAANPGLKLPEMEMISREEKQHVLRQFNSTEVPFPTGKMIHTLFEEQVERSPDRIAVVGKERKDDARGGSKAGFQCLTYRELSERSNRLARLLKAEDVSLNTIVGIMLERSIKILIAVLGVLKAGAAYLPIDPYYPKERIDYMLKDSNVKVLLAAPAAQDNVEVKVIDLYTTISAASQPPLSRVDSFDLAYVIYTSGSTGRPKGVMVQHDSFVNAAFAWIKEYRLASMEVNLLQMASFSFDVFSGDLARALLTGGKLVICLEDVILDFPSLYSLAVDQKITLCESTPSLILPFMEYVHENGLNIPYLQLLILGADVCPMEDFRKLVLHFGQRMRIVNSYGLTETTIDSSYFEGNLEGLPAKGNVPIGKPLPNILFYLLSAAGKIQPVGIPGELYVGGRGVSRGYLNQPELTADKFVSVSYWSYRSYRTYISSKKIYRTGDLARWLDDGNVEFLGRIDHQIKIRGFRVELGEIENQLLSYPGIKEAVLLDKEDKNGNKYLCACIIQDVLNRSKKIVLSELRAYLSGKLPAYMVPANFVVLDRIPLTPNGKVDMKALYNYDSEENIVPGTEYEAPTREVEKKLAEIWSEILLKKRIGINDNFFELGGQSLLAIKVISRIKELFNVKIPLITFFQRGNIREIAEIILDAPLKKQDSMGKSSERKGLIQPFELDSAPLLRAAVVELDSRRYFFFVDMHHIITDGISQDIIASEFAVIYSGGEPEESPLQYKDFSHWQENFFASEEFCKQEDYWLGIFNDEIPRLNLPLDYPRPEVKRGEGKVIRMNVGSELSMQLKRFAFKQEVTLFILLLAVYTILLAKTTGQEDIIVGTPVSGRSNFGVIRMVGMFVNTLALRNKPINRLTFYEYLEAVKQGTLDALENQDYPFNILVDKLNLAGDTARNPIFDTVFALEQSYGEDIGIRNDEITISPIEFEYTGSMFDLLLGAAVEDNDIRLYFRYDIHLFHEDTIRQMANHFITILSQVLHAPKRRIEDIDMSVPFEKDTPYAEIDSDTHENRLLNTGISAETSAPHETLSQQQRDWILYELNDTRMEYPEGMTIHQMFEQQAGATPFRMAVICEDRQMTYGELNRRSDQLAGLLLKKGIAAEGCVGLMMERSLELMVGILGILKAGGCYLPINHEYPEERIRFLIDDASINILLTQSSFQSPSLPGYAEHIILLDLLDYSDRHVLKPECHVLVKPARLAYVIYTSGSTGRPKGVMVEHQAVVGRLTWMQKTYPLSGADTVLQKTVFTFDVSIIELFGWFMGGARLCFLEPGAEKDLRKVLDTIGIQYVSAVSFTPTVLNTFFLSITGKDVRKLVSLKWIFCAGEPLPAALVEKWRKLSISAKLENLYGPTEATVYASYYSCGSQSYPVPIPIGKPLGNTHLYILNEQQRLVPPGKMGELYLAGGLSRGYLNRPDLTGERFFPDPFFPGARMYRTGDYAKLLPEGQVVYLGRMDNQVKIKGIRIELDEIEAVLLKHPGISEAAVIDQDDSKGRYLAAYIVPGRDLTLEELRAFLLRKLPDYMVPSVFFKIDKVPLTSSEKLNRKLLGELGSSIKMEAQYAAPRTELEHRLVQLWEETLKLDNIGIDHNFFEMGGDSLMGNLLLAKISGHFGPSIMIKDFFKAPTIRKFAELLSPVEIREHKLLEPVEKKDYYPASSAQQRLFVIQRLNNEDTSYNLSMGMIIEGRLDKERLKNSLKKLVQRHGSLRTRFEIKEGEIVQIVEDNPVFEVEFFEISGQPPGTVQKGERGNQQDIEKIIKGDIQLRHIHEEAQDHLLSTVKLTRVKRKTREI